MGLFKGCHTQNYRETCSAYMAASKVRHQSLQLFFRECCLSPTTSKVWLAYLRKLSQADPDCRVPRFSYEILTTWYTSGQPFLVERCFRYHILKAQLVIELLDEAEIVSRNACVEALESDKRTC